MIGKCTLIVGEGGFRSGQSVGEMGRGWVGRERREGRCSILLAGREPGGYCSREGYY